MLFQILFSLLFLLPLLGTMSVVLQCLKFELTKKNMADKKIHTLKLIGYLMLAATGLYIGLLLLGLIWIPDFDLPHAIKLVSFCLAVPYLFCVIGISFAVNNVAGFEGSSSKIVNHISENNSQG
ncbi:MAG: hypothetical protein PVJ19_02150 [Desulfobacteraceae bacterium]|jgi:hypothetical protein